MAGLAFPSWAYNSAGQAAQIVASQAAFNALASVGSWAFTPYVIATATAPVDVGFSNTDIRLQQILIEQRITNQLLQIASTIADDPVTQIRADILANDSSLVT